MKKKKLKLKGFLNEKGEFETFVNDKDGLSAKDFLLLVSVGVFFAALIVGFIAVLFGKKLGDEYFLLISAASPVVITVVGGVMGVQVAEIGSDAYKSGRQTKTDEGNYESEDDIL